MNISYRPPATHFCKGRHILALLLMYLLFTALFASQPFSARAYLVSYPQSVVTAVKDPLTWEAQDWLKAGAVLAISTALYFTEQEIRDWALDQQNTWMDGAADVFRQPGEVLIMLPATALTALGGYLWQDPHTMDTGLLSFKSLFLAAAATGTLQFLSQMPRPEDGMGNQFHSSSGFKWSRDSFPSGHATVVWSIAPILSHQYPHQKWLPPLVYSIATLTSLSRIYEDKHWSSDVFAGAVIGWLAARLTLKSTPTAYLAPTTSGKGITLGFEF